MSNDIAALLEIKGWTELGKKRIDIVDTSPANSLGFETAFTERFPKLTRLLKLARVTDFQTRSERGGGSASKAGDFPSDGVVYRLWAWTTHSGQFAAWPASPITSIVVPPLARLSEDHLLILRHVGGINWLGTCQPEDFEDENHNFALNQNFIFGMDAPALSTKLWMQEYDFQHQNKSADTLIEPYVDFASSDWVCFAQEANGNELLYDRRDGDRVLLVSGDNCFDYVRPSQHYRWQYRSESYESDTLLQINGIVTLRDWAERLAEQWLAQVG